MGKIWCRLVAATLVVGAFTAVAPGVASAHTFTFDGRATCVDSGGWTAIASLSVSEPYPASGTTTASYPAGSSTSWTATSDATITFGDGVVVPTSVASVRFEVVGEWENGTPIEGSVVLEQPAGCTDPTTTTEATTTTTEAATTTTVADATTSTTTTIAGDLTITGITPICVRDAPFVRITFGNQPELNGRTAAVTFIDVNGVVVASHTATYTANGSVSFVYPGASLDAAGNATDWPGWVFDGDDWVPDPTDDHLRRGLTVRVVVNPTATGQVAYPPPTTACADPPTGDATSGALPTTGSANGGIAWAAGAALLLGVSALALSRRRAA